VGAGGISHAVDVGKTLRSNYLIVSAIMGAVTGLYRAFAILLALMLSSAVLSAVIKTPSQDLPHRGLENSFSWASVHPMESSGFSKVLRGYEPAEVDAKVIELRAEIADLAAALTQSHNTNTELRLSVIKQVEQASAEAAVVLNHSRSEAVRTREAAVEESNEILRKAQEHEQKIRSDMESLRDEVNGERGALRASVEELIGKAREDAGVIVAEAITRAESIRLDVIALQEEAVRKTKEVENDLRLKKLELERAETDIREQADAYAMRVYREADEYARSSERRSLDMEKQAEEILHQARVMAREKAANSSATSRHYLEEALGTVNTIFSDVNGSLLGIQRIRQILGDSVDRIATDESTTLGGAVVSEIPEVSPSLENGLKGADQG